MATSDVKSLIKFLQHHGGPVISGHRKLSLTPSALRELNSLLRAFKEDAYSTMSATQLYGKYADRGDVTFAYDFVRKTPKLKLCDMHGLSFQVDVGDFTNLRYLEVYKFNVKNILGLQRLRDTLEMVVCNRCVEKIGDLLLESDANGMLIWSRLRHAVLARNELTTLDDSFICTPWLQYLDVSYNHLKDLRPLASLQNLTHLNAGFNELTAVPEFAMCKLKVLLLNNNFIGDLTGLMKSVSLRECDLSGNCITEHVSLAPLAELASLISLNLSNNPISFHPMHRSLTCGYLHENAANENIYLDNYPLSSSEREFIRCCSRNNLIYEINSKSLTSGTISLNETTSDNEKQSVVKRVGSRIRDPLISEQSFEENDADLQENAVDTTITSVDSDSDEIHLEVKKQLEELRNQYGKDHWLASVKVQDILGIECTNQTSVAYSTDISESNSPYKNSPGTNEVTCKVENSSENNDISDVNVPSVDSSSHDERSDSVYHCSSTESDNSISSDDEDVPEHIPDVTPWVVQRKTDDSVTDMFLLLNNVELKELSVSKYKTLAVWGLDSVETCTKISNDPITVSLTFNTVIKMNQSRIYYMEYADAQKLISQIEAEIQRRPLRAFNQQVLRCMKCNHVFCTEIKRKRMSGLIPVSENHIPADKEPKYSCAFCKSTAVIEEDESSIFPNKAKTMEYSSSPQNGGNSILSSLSSFIKQSPSLSSIGSAASLEHGENYNQDEAYSTQHESDIEIISNPSQSSIEVLEVHGRLQDSDTVIKHIISDDKIGSTQLTESSSSGSMTDSVCTTYETAAAAAAAASPRGSHRVSQSTVDEPLPEESSSIENSPDQRGLAKQDRRLENEVVSYVAIIDDLIHQVGKFVPKTNSSNSLTAPPARGRTSIYFSSKSKYEYSYHNFANVDHRIKLHVFDQIFTQSPEELLCLLRAEQICKCGTSVQPFPGLLILSNKRLYIVKIINEEKDEDVDSFLQKYENYPSEKVKQFHPIFWGQGFFVELEERWNSQNYVILLYDKERTDSFLAFVKDLGSIHVQNDAVPDDNNLKAILHADDKVRNLTMTESITVLKDQADDEVYNFVGLLITNEEFMIVKGESEWLLPNASIEPNVVLIEKICNLVNIEESEHSVALQFVNELEGTDKLWVTKTVTANANVRIVEAIREPWEALFSVQLPVSQVII